MLEEGRGRSVMLRMKRKKDHAIRRKRRKCHVKNEEEEISC